MTPGEFRLRIVYRKAGRLRHLSHLEIVHALERVIRRADLPYAVTKGFNPHLKAAFGPALPVGTAGDREYLDVWVTRYTAPAAVFEALARASAPDLSPLEVRYVSSAEPSLTAALTIGVYRIEVDGKELTKEGVQAGLTQVMGEGELAFEHKGKHKVFDLAQSIPKEPSVHDLEGGVAIDLTVRMGPKGSLRPEMLVRKALDIRGLAATAMRTTRLETLVESDEGVWSRPV